MSAKVVRKQEQESQGSAGFLKLIKVCRQFIGTDKPIQELNELASNLIMEFVSPLLEQIHSVRSQHNLILLGILVWNVSLASDEKQESAKNSALEMAKGTPEAETELEKIWYWLMERKQTAFADHSIYVISYEIMEEDGVASVRVSRSVEWPAAW